MQQNNFINIKSLDRESFISPAVRAFFVPSLEQVIPSLGLAFLRFTCPTAQINSYSSRKKKHLRSKMFSAIFVARRAVYADPHSDTRRAGDNSY